MGVFNITESVDAWSIDKVYSVGTYVKNNGKTYKAKQNVPLGVNIGFDDYWEEIVTNDDINALSGKVKEIDEQLSATVGTASVPFRFVYDTTSEKYGYLDGADTFHPF